MTNLPTVRNPNDLYPLKIDRDFAELIQRLMIGAERDPVGALTIKKSPTDDERRAISARGKELARHLVAAKRSDIKPTIQQMIVGFGKPATEEEAEAITMVFIEAMVGLPLFAVKQAAGRFMRGEVTASELGERMLSRGFTPSTAHLRVVADRVVARFNQELYAANAILKAKIAKPIDERTEQSKARVRDLARNLFRTPDATVVPSKTDEDRKQDEASAKIAEIAKQARIDEYAAVNADPVYRDGKIVPLSILLSTGWEIKEIGGERLLVQPSEDV